METLRDALVQPAALRGLERQQRRQRRGGRSLAVERRERPAGEPPDLEGTLDALAVGRRQPRGGDGIDACQLGVQRGPAARCGLGIERGAQAAVRRRHLVQAVEQRLEVEHRAADQQRQSAARVDLADQPRRVGDELRRRVGLARVEHVDQVMRHGGAFGGTGFGGADVHVAVDQRRVDADDFDAPVRLERFGDRERGRALARGRRPCEAQAGQRGAHQAARGASAVRCGSPWRWISVHAVNAIAIPKPPIASVIG